MYSVEESTTDIVINANKAILVLQEKLKVKTKTFKKTIDSKGQKLFDHEQEAWLKFTQAKVSFAADNYRGGSLSRVIAARSMVREYKARITAVDDYIKNYNRP